MKKPESIQEFIDEEGIDTIVDMLEDRQNAVLQNQILNFLVDITTDNASVAEVLKKWMSERTHNSLSKLLIKLWCEEEKRLGSRISS